ESSTARVIRSAEVGRSDRRAVLQHAADAGTHWRRPGSYHRSRKPHPSCIARRSANRNEQQKRHNFGLRRIVFALRFRSFIFGRNCTCSTKRNAVGGTARRLSPFCTFRRDPTAAQGATSAGKRISTIANTPRPRKQRAQIKLDLC